MLELFTSPEAWVSLAVLTLMEIVLGIDNIVFISILTDRVDPKRRVTARRLGVAAALVSRLVLLFSISWVMRLEDVLFTFLLPWSGKDLILLGGGLFLLYKATSEIYENVEHPRATDDPDSLLPHAGEKASLAPILGQVMLLDIVFSLDSVITAVGMAEHLEIMVVAVVIAVIVMLVFARAIGDFVTRTPSVRILALAFLVLIGAMLVMESTGQHVSKGYIYSAMGFSLFVQVLNMRADHRHKHKT